MNNFASIEPARRTGCGKREQTLPHRILEGIGGRRKFCVAEFVRILPSSSGVGILVDPGKSRCFVRETVLCSRSTSREAYTGETMTLSPASSDVPPQPVSSAPALRSGYRRGWWIIGLLVLAGLGYGVSSWMTRLSPFERQFVGEWTTTETYPDGSTCTKRLTLRSNRTGHIHTSAHWVASRGVAPNQEYDTDLSWAIRDGRLWFDSQSLSTGHLLDFSNRALHRLRNRVIRTACACDYAGVSDGRLSEVGADSFSVNWLVPQYQAERETEVYVRVVAEPPFSE